MLRSSLVDIISFRNAGCFLLPAVNELSNNMQDTIFIV